MLRSISMGRYTLWLTYPLPRYTNPCICLFLARFLDAECGGGIQHPPREQFMISMLLLETVKQNAARTVTITSTILLSGSGDCETTQASANSLHHSGITGGGPPVIASPHPPCPTTPVFFSRLSVDGHDIFIHLETHVDNVYYSREDDIEQGWCASVQS